MVLQTAFFTIIIFLIASDQGIHFTANEREQWAHVHGIHWSFHIPCHPETASSPFEVTVPVRWQYFEGLGKILQHVMYALNQHPLYGTVSPIARIPESSNQNVDVGAAPLTISPSVRFLSLQTYYLCWPSGLSCKRKSISTRRPQWVR